LENLASVVSQDSSPYGATYYTEHERWHVDGGTPFTLPVRVRNTGSMAWETAHPPFNLGARWLLVDGTELPGEPDRTPLPAVVQPGESVELLLVAVPPRRKGIYTLRVSMVHEGHAWF